MSQILKLQKVSMRLETAIPDFSFVLFAVPIVVFDTSVRI